jgi:Fe-coproporphyrin III synthase
MKEQQPVFLFEITQKCEYKCRPCYENILVASDHDEMRLWEWLITIESIAEQEGRLIIAGGDPFLRQDLYDIVSYATVLGVDVELATCGLNLTIERIDELKKNGVESVIIRLDGITRDENDSYRGMCTYDEALNALRLLKENGMKASLVINSDADKNKIDDASRFSRETDVPLFVAGIPQRGAPSIIRSRCLQQLTEAGTHRVEGTIIDPEGRMYDLHDSGVQYSGEIQTNKYKFPPRVPS